MSHPHLTPVHCYTLQHQQTGELCWVLVNGGYCDGPGEQRIAEQHPAWDVIASTWRSNWTHLACPSNSEPHYQDDGPGHATPSRSPWATSSDPLSADAA